MVQSHPTTERRGASRKTLHYPGRLSYGADNRSRDCMVWDLSALGARLTVNGADTIPQKFVLIVAEENGLKWNCQVTWRSQQQIGVAFLGVPLRCN